MKLLIKVTKDIIRQSMYCGFEPGLGSTQNCVIAMALKPIFSNVTVGSHAFRAFFGCDLIQLPEIVHGYILNFDMCNKPEDRLLLPELDFEIELPQDALRQLDMDDFKTKIETAPNICII